MNKKYKSSYETATKKVIGRKLKKRRLQLGLTQSKVGHAVNVTFQQIQKYEKGTNGLSGFMVKRIAHSLDIPRYKVGYLIYKYNYGFKGKTQRDKSRIQDSKTS